MAAVGVAKIKVEGVEELREVRDLLQEISGVAEGATARIFRIRPGDTLVLRFPGRLTQDEAERVKEIAEGVFEGVKVAIITDGADIDVLRREE